MVRGIGHPWHLDAGKPVIADSLRPNLQSGPAFHRFWLDAEAFARFCVCHPYNTHGRIIEGETSPRQSPRTSGFLVFKGKRWCLGLPRPDGNPIDWRKVWGSSVGPRWAGRRIFLSCSLSRDSVSETKKPAEAGLCVSTGPVSAIVWRHAPNRPQSQTGLCSPMDEGKDMSRFRKNQASHALTPLRGVYVARD